MITVESKPAPSLSDILMLRIKEEGPIGLDEFMGIALGHPDHGYYMNRDPLGKSGDFTTAPEVSQMFGEMIGAWLADVWMQFGKPRHFILAEAGPGRGSLMADILRTAKGISGFYEAADVHLIEMSPALKEKQSVCLNNHKVTWHDTIDTLPTQNPVFFIANEFFDALPLKQYVFHGGLWFERKVGAENEALAYINEPCDIDPLKGLDLSNPEEGSIIELAPSRTEFMKKISLRLKVQSGAGLIIDYGHKLSGYGDTFQAMRAHEYTNPLDKPGECDLTSHVDFQSLRDFADKEGIVVYGVEQQGKFLLSLGIQLRARQLLQITNGQKAKDIQKALHRLTHSDEMGSLFKVMGVSYGASIQPAGF